MKAFRGDSLPKIAEKLGVNYHTLRNWAKGRSDIPSSELIKIAEMTTISLNWLLTGQGEMYVAAKVFDLEYSVDQHDDWRPVMEEWFEWEGKEMPETMGASFMGGWNTLTREERMDAIRDFKMLLDKIADGDEPED